MSDLERKVFALQLAVVRLQFVCNDIALRFGLVVGELGGKR